MSKCEREKLGGFTLDVERMFVYNKAVFGALPCKIYEEVDNG